MKPIGPARWGVREEGTLKSEGPDSDSGSVLPSCVALDKLWHKISTLLNIWGGHISVNVCKGAYKWEVLPRCVNEWIWDNKQEAASTAPSTWLVCNRLVVVLRRLWFWSGLPDRKHLTFCQGQICPRSKEKETRSVSCKTHCPPGSSSVFLCSDSRREMDLLCDRGLCLPSPCFLPL